MASSGCVDQDPFGLNYRTILGKYELNQFEGGVYYLDGPGGPDGGGWGCLEGTVGKIGWNDRYIVVWQRDGGSGEGWRIVDSQLKTVGPLLSDADLDTAPEVQDVETMSPGRAWRGLSWWR